MINNITFLLPGYSNKPIGGYKIVYEYTNRLIADGYVVNIVFPIRLLWYSYGFLHKTKLIILFLISKVYKCCGIGKWFDLDSRVKLKLTWNLSERKVPISDIYIATSIETAVELAKFNNINNNNKFYFIQGFESWGKFNENKVFQSYRLPMKKIVISENLLDIVKSAGGTAELVHNGFDSNKFYISLPIEEKNKYSVTMLYHTSLLKGCKDGIDALNTVKKQFPQLKAIFFGKDSPSENLPSWIKFYKKPSPQKLNEIYNNSAIYIGTSHSEGMGLVIGEAMLCGAAIACTDIGGYRTLAKNMETALLSPIKDPQKLAVNIIKLIEDDELRFKLATNGNIYMKNFSWDIAYNKMKHALLSDPCNDREGR